MENKEVMERMVEKLDKMVNLMLEIERLMDKMEDNSLGYPFADSFDEVRNDVCGWKETLEENL